MLFLFNSVMFLLSITSYQTLPRKMPSHRVPYMPHYGDSYRSMPRNSMAQRDSICSMSPSLYDQALGPSVADKRRSMRDDTMWQLYEWQQRQAYSRQPGLYSNMTSPQTMINLSEHAAPSHSIPPSPSHGSLSVYGGYSPLRSFNMANARSELTSPIYRRESSLDRRHRPQINKVFKQFHLQSPCRQCSSMSTSVSVSVQRKEMELHSSCKTEVFYVKMTDRSYLFHFRIKFTEERV